MPNWVFITRQAHHTKTTSLLRQNGVDAAFMVIYEQYDLCKKLYDGGCFNTIDEFR